MKYIASTLLCVILTAGFARADTLMVSNANYSLRANSDTLFNLEFYFQGPQVSLNGYMTTCKLGEFCFGYPEFLLPGTFVDPHATVGYGYDSFATGSITLSGRTYTADALQFSESSIEGTGFLLPPGGKTYTTFSVTVPATFADVAGFAIDGNSYSATPFALIIPPGKLTLTFDYWPQSCEGCYPSAYWFKHGTYIATTAAPTPEPGTLLMLGSAVLGIAGVLQRKFVS